MKRAPIKTKAVDAVRISTAKWFLVYEQGNLCKYLDGRGRVATVHFSTETRVQAQLEARPGCKRLTDGQVEEIRFLATEALLTQREIAAMYGISDPYVSMIKHGRGRKRRSFPSTQI